MNSPKRLIYVLFLFMLATVGMQLNCAANEKELKIRLERWPENLHPAEAVTIEAQFIAAQAYQNLFVTGFDGSILPSLATSWTQSKDKRTLIIKLQRVAKFSDGTPVTSQHVIEMFKRTIRIGTFRGFDRIIGAKAFRDGMSKDLPGVKILGVDTVQIRLNQAYPRILQEFGDQKVVVLLEKSGGALPLGSGPYKIDEVVKEQNKVVLRKNPYFSQRPVSFDKVVFSTAGGDVDVSVIDPGEHTKIKFNKLPIFETEVYFLGANADSPHLSTLAARQFLFSKLTKELVDSKTWIAPYEPTSFLPMGMMGYDPEKSKVEPKAPLQENILKMLSGQTITVATYHPRLEAIAVAYCAQLKTVGVNCQLVKTDFGGLLDLRKNKKLNLFFARFKPTVANSEDILGVFARGHTVNLFTPMNIKNTLTRQFDDLYTKILNTDFEAREELVSSYKELDLAARSTFLVRPIRYGSQKAIWVKPGVVLPKIGIQGFLGIQINDIVAN